jgi:cyanophycinase-like exopeptidase
MEGLTLRDAEIPPMDTAQGREAVGGPQKRRFGFLDDTHVDQRICCETRNGGVADVFYGGRFVTQSIGKHPRKE